MCRLSDSDRVVCERNEMNHEMENGLEEKENRREFRSARGFFSRLYVSNELSFLNLFSTRLIFVPGTFFYHLSVLLIKPWIYCRNEISSFSYTLLRSACSKQ